MCILFWICTTCKCYRSVVGEDDGKIVSLKFIIFLVHALDCIILTLEMPHFFTH